jgi:hypothetical protein
MYCRLPGHRSIVVEVVEVWTGRELSKVPKDIRLNRKEGGRRVLKECCLNREGIVLGILELGRAWRKDCGGFRDDRDGEDGKILRPERLSSKPRTRVRVD